MTLQKKRICITTAVFCVLALIVVKLVWFNSYLTGDKTHDFGFVEVVPPNTTLDHTFVLTNTSGKELFVKDVVPDCGCTTMSAFQESIPIGEEFILDVQLKLRQSQIRKSSFRIIFDDGSIEVLTLFAEGRVKEPLRISSSPIIVKANGEIARAILGTEQFDEEVPPEVKLVAPKGMTVTAAKWKLKSKRKASAKIPAIWTTQLTLTSDNELEAGSELQITVGSHHMHVALTSVPSADEDSMHFMHSH